MYSTMVLAEQAGVVEFERSEYALQQMIASNAYLDLANALKKEARLMQAIFIIQSTQEAAMWSVAGEKTEDADLAEYYKIYQENLGKMAEAEAEAYKMLQEKEKQELNNLNSNMPWEEQDYIEKYINQQNQNQPKN